MKKLLLLLAITSCVPAAAQFAGIRRIQPPIQTAPLPPDEPVTDPSPDFPLHVRLIRVVWGTRLGDYEGYGSGNLLGDTPKGFDFTFDCSIGFNRNLQPDEFYQARWKKPDQQIEVLMRPIGNDHEQSCTLKIAWKPQPFTAANTAALRFGISTFLGPYWRIPAVAYLLPTPDPEYPLQLHVISSYPYYDNFGMRASGSGNLLGSPNTGVDFTYACSTGFLPNTQSQEFFPARWIKPHQQIEILFNRPGSDHVDSCKLDILEKSRPYAPNPAPSIAFGKP